jgi:hypothetical protein
VREVYRSKGWALLDVEKVEQCRHEGYKEEIEAQKGEGCHIWGELHINKVRGQQGERQRRGQQGERQRRGQQGVRRRGQQGERQRTSSRTVAVGCSICLRAPPPPTPFCVVSVPV